VSPAGRDPRYDVLFEPVRIGPKTMRNRFYQTPYATGFGDSVADQRGNVRFREVRAEGGWAVISSDVCSVHPESDLRGFAEDARIWSDDDIAPMAEVTDAIHAHGALASVELYFGAASPNDWTRLAPRGPSQTTNDMTWSTTSYAMDVAEIRELQGWFVAAAKRARSAGFDIVNVCANSQMNIVQQFLLPAYNQRTDAYGGSLENRARFLVELLEQLKQAVGDDCALTTRLTVDTLDEGREGGIRAAEDGAATVALCDHLVDFWDLDVGGMSISGEVARWGVGASPSRLRESGWEEPWIELVRSATRKPIAGVGRFTDPERMIAALRGPLDIIGAARPGIADPFLPAKIEAGDVDDIAECIGCNICIMRYARGVPVNCTQNPTAGEEHRRGWHPRRFAPAAGAEQMAVLVVGAGPAGMECATVLGKRGAEHVHLADAERVPGGALRWTTELPGLAEWGRVIDYRRTQIERLRNVTFVPRKRLTADDVLGYGASTVIVATGSHWAGDGRNPAMAGPIPGADAALAHVATPEQIMVEGKAIAGEHVVVFDADGGYMGVSLAELLAARGQRVTIVSPQATIGIDTFLTEEGPDIYRRLLRAGVELLPATVVTEIAPGAVTTRSTLLPEAVDTLAADGVVLVTQRVSDDGLFRELRERADERAEAGVERLLRIGDCVAPRLLADAIFDGHRLGREIDSGQDEPLLPLRG
jgi:dimethylamine/trimethylamine dehydrogenase